MSELLGDHVIEPEILIRNLDEWVETLNMPSLDQYGITESGIKKILDLTSIKNCPAPLDRNDIRRIIEMRL